MIRAVCIGECMVEMRPAGDGLYARGFAGDAYNTAVYLRRALGDAGRVSMLTVVGDDSTSDAMRAEFEAQGLETDRVWTAPGKAPGLYVVELDAHGDRSFLYWRGQSAARDWLKQLQAKGGARVLEGADLVYLSGISLAILPDEDRRAVVSILQDLRGKVGRIAFDPNLRLRLWEDLPTASQAIDAAAAASDVVLPSQQDGELLWNVADPADQMRRWMALGPTEVGLTLADQGARVADASGQEAIPAVAPIAVVDTSGAGDSFNGAYLAARLLGETPRQAAEAGVRLAAKVVATRGALIPR